MVLNRIQAEALKRVFAVVVLSAVAFLPLSEGLLYAAPKANAQIQADSQTAKVNLNKASLEELQTVRGIGPALAERIIQYRDEHGRFERIEDIVQVRGVGEAKFEKLKSQVSI